MPFIQHVMAGVDGAGETLLYIPHQAEMSESQTAVCTACECYALAWISDLCGTIPTMLAIEPRYAHDSLSTFAGYTLCWPCRLLSRKPIITSKEQLVMRDAEFEHGWGVPWLKVGGDHRIPYPWHIRELDK